LFHGDVTGNLYHPGLIGVWGHASDMHFSGAESDKEEDVIRHEPTQGPDLSREEVGGHQDVDVRMDKLFPRSGLLPLWGWEKAMAFQDVPDGLVTHGVPQIGQGSHDTIRLTLQSPGRS